MERECGLGLGLGLGLEFDGKKREFGWEMGLGVVALWLCIYTPGKEYGYDYHL